MTNEEFSRLSDSLTDEDRRRLNVFCEGVHDLALAAWDLTDARERNLLELALNSFFDAVAR
jgi:hypothetical protein